MNYFNENEYPDMYTAIQKNITNQTSNFIITELNTWETEKDFIAEYYHPYTNNTETSTFNYKILWRNRIELKHFVLLLKNN